MAEEKVKAEVVNRHTHPLDIRLYKREKDEFGYEHMVRDGEAVTLQPGVNSDIDRAFIEKWREQNKQSNLVNFIKFLDDEKREQDEVAKAGLRQEAEAREDVAKKARASGRGKV